MVSQLVLIVCLLGTPGQCEEHRPPTEALTPMSCMVRGQEIAQDWLSRHPDWKLGGWRCEAGSGHGSSL